MHYSHRNAVTFQRILVNLEFHVAQTVYGTQLSDAEVDELFTDLEIKEHEVVDYKQLVLALTSGFQRLEWNGE